MSGSTKYPAIHKSLLRVGTNQIDTKQTTSRLCPINRAPKGQTLYDTIAFFIFCPKHRKIAVCNTFHGNHGIAFWMPFIYLSKQINYEFAIKDGVCLILSDYEINLLNKYKEELPFDTKIVNTIEVYLPKTNKYVHRINCLAILRNDKHGFQCCRSTSRINWLNIEDVSANSQDQFWGPQLGNQCSRILKLKIDPDSIKFSFYLSALPLERLGRNYYLDYNVDTAEDYILYSLEITRKQIDLLFTDFFEHCFPSLTMTFHSFADYLSKYGFRETNYKMQRIFNALRYIYRSPYYKTPALEFDDLLLGLAYIDKDSPQDTIRLLFVFNFYDQNRDGFLSEVEFKEMVTEIHKNEGQEEIERIVAEAMNGNESPKGMNWNEFYNRAKSHEFGDATLLGKSDVSLIRNILEYIKAKTTPTMDTLKSLFPNFKKY